MKRKIEKIARTFSIDYFLGDIESLTAKIISLPSNLVTHNDFNSHSKGATFLRTNLNNFQL
jgi:hypothetical protein